MRKWIMWYGAENPTIRLSNEWSEGASSFLGPPAHYVWSIEKFCEKINNMSAEEVIDLYVEHLEKYNSEEREAEMRVVLSLGITTIVEMRKWLVEKSKKNENMRFCNLLTSGAYNVSHDLFASHVAGFSDFHVAQRYIYHRHEPDRKEDWYYSRLISYEDMKEWYMEYAKTNQEAREFGGLMCGLHTEDYEGFRKRIERLTEGEVAQRFNFFKFEK